MELDEVCRALVRAGVDRHHEWRTPVLATVDALGCPQVRTVVLRRVMQQGRVVEVYTDARTPKVAELQAQPAAALLFWSRRLSLQLRFHALAEVFTRGPEVDAAWSAMAQAPSAGDYLAPAAPGSPLRRVAEAPAPQPEGMHHLAVLRFRAQSWDVLSLDRAGHRRWAWRFDAAGAVIHSEEQVP